MNVPFGVVVYLVILLLGLAFRLGRPERWSRRMARALRSDPVAYGRVGQSIPLIWPFLCIWLLPLIVFFWALSNSPPDWPHWARSLTSWGFASYGALMTGVTPSRRDPSSGLARARLAPRG